MAVKRTKKTTTKRKLPALKKKLVSKSKTKSRTINFESTPFYIFLRMLLKSPFILINKISLMLIKLASVSFVFVKKIILFLLQGKEAFFSIIFGLLSGGIASVMLYSFFEFNSQIDSNVNEKNISDISFLKKELNELKSLTNSVARQNEENNVILNKIADIEASLITTTENSLDNSNRIVNVDKEIVTILQKSEFVQEGLKKLEQDILNNSKLMMSSSKTELSNRLYLAQSLVDRLKSGVPYAPQLVALGEQGVHPALLRYAKGGAPTLSDLAARLSVRAGELRDADKTKRDVNWRDNLKSEISKYVKIRPTDINNIKGTSGALLRAEDAISRGNLEKAIKEVDSLTPKDRGMLNAWLSEAKARQSANIAAENLLAKTTAALRKKN